MVNKNYFLLAGLCIMLSAFSSKAQEDATIQQSTTTTTTTVNAASATQSRSRDMAYRGMSYDVLDTSYVPRYRMEQHRRFLNYEYQFPAKPRNMWEVGVGAGLYNASADVPNLMLWEGGGYGFHGHIRKAWGYTFSSRLQYIYGVAKGLQWQQTENYKYNQAWNTNYDYADMYNNGDVHVAEDRINYNFRTETHQLNIDFIFNTNNIKFHRARTALSVYGFIGFGGFLFNTRINTLDANGNKYDFGKIIGDDITQVHGNRREIKRRLKDGMDKTYETDAENERGKRRPGLFGNKTIDFSYSAGIGLAYRISNHVNLSFEHRLTVPHEEDLLDGQRWAEQVYGNPVFTQNNDFIVYSSLGVNFNLGSSKRNVEPLYWLNPLDYGYGEIANPSHMKLDAMLPDADMDGVTDQFDQCPGTPEGVPVDVNGCPMDTDGDGVPDYRDKQLITPTECQPVDEDGIGKCPCPDCMVGPAKGPCTNIGSGSITFDAGTTRLKPYNQARLAALAAVIKANPECRIVIIGSGNGSKVLEQRSWDRVEAVISYMTERHAIDRTRFIFQYGQPGDANTIMWRSAMDGEDGPSNAAPPFPNLRKD